MRVGGHLQVPRRSVAKADVVAADERENGRRALLNLGHTFGHALEAATQYDSSRLVHGEGVSIGMVLAHRFSARMNLVSPDLADRVEAHLKAVGLPTRMDQIPGELPPTEVLMDAGRLADMLTFLDAQPLMADGRWHSDADLAQQLTWRGLLPAEAAAAVPVMRALEQRLRQALLDDDHDALTALVSPALFMMDGQGGRLLDLPWLGDWLAGNLQVRSLQSYAVETLLCGRLALLSSDVRLSVRGQGRERELKLRLLRVWTCSSGGSGAQLLSMAVLAA